MKPPALPLDALRRNYAEAEADLSTARDRQAEATGRYLAKRGPETKAALAAAIDARCAAFRAARESGLAMQAAEADLAREAAEAAALHRLHEEARARRRSPRRPRQPCRPRGRNASPTMPPKEATP